MTKSKNVTIGDELARTSAGRVAMISLMAISVSMAAAPVHAQTIDAPADMTPADMPMQSPVAVPQPAPPSTMQSPPATSADTANGPAVSPTRADALATRGGFDADTVAPEALAQIESEQQAREAAAAKSAATAPVAAAPASAPDSAAESRENSMVARQSPPASADETIAPAAGFTSISPATQSAPTAAETAAIPVDSSGDTNLNLLAALAALLGVGAAGAIVTTRRRKRAAPQAAGQSGSDSAPASVEEAIMPELRGDPVAAGMPSSQDAELTLPTTADPSAQQRATRTDFAEFVASLPGVEKNIAPVDRNITNAQRRVAAAPKPYLNEADRYRPAGYFMANVHSMPTAQNPFLSRQKRLKRARYLDGKLAEMKASMALRSNQVTGEMQAARRLQPAFG